MNAVLLARVRGVTLSALLLLAISLPAAATLRTIEQAYELTSSQVQLPETPDGQLTVRPCATCRTVSLRATAATTWFIGPGTVKAGGQPAGQAAFLEAFRAAATNPQALVYVYYEPQTRRVKRIVLDVPAPAAAHR